MNFAVKIFVIVTLIFSICFSVQAQENAVKWADAKQFLIAGKGWSETKNFYDRLPARAEAKVRAPVWNLSQNSAGISVRFTTDSAEIHLRWTLRNQTLSLGNMPAASHSGLDLYVKENGAWRWAAVGIPTKFPTNERRVIANMTRTKREYLLYLPLYNGVESVEIGVTENAEISKPETVSAAEKPIVFYGTSIVQGASASRAGLAYPAILSRRLNVAAINLGFSGNCKLEPELAEFLSEIDARMYFVDCLPNIKDGAEVEEKLPNFIKILRAKRPNVPIVLVENLVYPDTFLETKKREVVESKNKGLQKVFAALKKTDKNLQYIPAANLIGNDGESTIDGVHPTDIGFMRMADNFQPVIAKKLKLKKQ